MDEDKLKGQYTKRRTMIRDQVGQTRYSTYELPDENFTYGRKNPKAEHDCGSGFLLKDILNSFLFHSILFFFKVISNWVPFVPSAGK